MIRTLWRRWRWHKSPPNAWEPGYWEWAADQAERISAFLEAARRGR